MRNIEKHTDSRTHTHGHNFTCNLQGTLHTQTILRASYWHMAIERCSLQLTLLSKRFATRACVLLLRFDLLVDLNYICNVMRMEKSLHHFDLFIVTDKLATCLLSHSHFFNVFVVLAERVVTKLFHRISFFFFLVCNNRQCDSSISYDQFFDFYHRM